MKITFIRLVQFSHCVVTGARSRSEVEGVVRCSSFTDGTGGAGGVTAARRQFVPLYREQGGAREEWRRGGDCMDVGTVDMTWSFCSL